MNLVKVLHSARDLGLQQRDHEDDWKLLGNCYINVYNSVSQNFQDIWVLHETKFKKNGYFVDVGSAGSKKDSNSYLLENEYDWSGVLVEPNTHWHDDIIQNRKSKLIKKCVYKTSNQKAKFLSVTNDPSLSSMEIYAKGDEHAAKRDNHTVSDVDTISLYDLLEENNAPENIDFLSLDTEGGEFYILESFFNTNKSKYKIKMISVEHNFVEPPRGWIKACLENNGYKRKFVQFSFNDDFYVLAN